MLGHLSPIKGGQGGGPRVFFVKLDFEIATNKLDRWPIFEWWSRPYLVQIRPYLTKYPEHIKNPDFTTCIWKFIKIGQKMTELWAKNYMPKLIDFAHKLIKYQYYWIILTNFKWKLSLNYIFSVSYSFTSVSMWILTRKNHKQWTKFPVSLVTILRNWYHQKCNNSISFQNFCMKFSESTLNRISALF